MSTSTRSTVALGANMATWVLVVLAVLWTLVNADSLVRRLRRPESEPFRQVSASFGYPDGGQTLGRKGAPVRIVVLSDYQCEACKHLWRQLATKFEDVEVTYFHYPLKNHPGALQGAVAAVCTPSASAFRGVSDSLFAHPELITRELTIKYALASGVGDVARFRDCLSDTTTLRKATAGRLLAGQLAVRATPTIIIGRDVYEGVPWDLERIIDRHQRASGVH